MEEGRKQDQGAKPTLVLFYTSHSGRCRRVEGFLAQVLQRRGNHETFKLLRVDVDAKPELATRFGVDAVPTLAVVEEKRLRGRLPDPRGCNDIAAFLGPWLR